MKQLLTFFYPRVTQGVALGLLLVGLNASLCSGQAVAASVTHANATLYGAHSFIETHQIEDILSHVGEKLEADTLLIFDLDNTLIEPHQLLGSDQWFEHHFKQQQAAFGKENSAALTKTVQDYDAVHLRSEVRLIDPKTQLLFQQLKQLGIKMLGLTSRGTALKEATDRQLSSVGLSFRSSWLERVQHYVLKNSKRGSAVDGIVLTGGGHKGNCLIEYLDHLKFKPSRVIFIDDKPHHLDHVKTVLEARQIPFTGIRYGFLDEKVKSFDPTITEIQLEYLSKILSDEDAQVILEARSRKALASQSSLLKDAL